jgi:hypothetical protein
MTKLPIKNKLRELRLAIFNYQLTCNWVVCSCHKSENLPHKFIPTIATEVVTNMTKLPIKNKLRELRSAIILLPAHMQLGSMFLSQVGKFPPQIYSYHCYRSDR